MRRGISAQRSNDGLSSLVRNWQNSALWAGIWRCIDSKRLQNIWRRTPRHPRKVSYVSMLSNLLRISTERRWLEVFHDVNGGVDDWARSSVAEFRSNTDRVAANDFRWAEKESRLVATEPGAHSTFTACICDLLYTAVIHFITATFRGVSLFVSPLTIAI